MPSKSSPAEKRPRGRPSHKPTPALRRKVSIAAGGGMRHEDIALALGISRVTLAKYYESELSGQAALRRMETLSAMHAAARRGSSSAAKLYLAVEPEVAAPPADGSGIDRPTAPVTAAAPAKPLGKKDQANVDAVTAAVGTEWSELLKPPTAPLQ